eukprot:Clim_evm35s246 gene=Clim_evmTU35s246
MADVDEDALLYGDEEEQPPQTKTGTKRSREDVEGEDTKGAVKKEDDEEADEDEYTEEDSDSDDELAITMGDVDASKGNLSKALAAGTTETPATAATTTLLKTEAGAEQKPGATGTATAEGDQKGAAGLLDLNAPGDIRGQSTYDVDPAEYEERPWRAPGADISDYFNYGFTEETWRAYCEKQYLLRQTGVDMLEFLRKARMPVGDEDEHRGVGLNRHRGQMRDKFRQQREERESRNHGDDGGDDVGLYPPGMMPGVMPPGYGMDQDENDGDQGDVSDYEADTAPSSHRYDRSRQGGDRDRRGGDRDRRDRDRDRDRGDLSHRSNRRSSPGTPASQDDRSSRAPSSRAGRSDRDRDRGRYDRSGDNRGGNRDRRDNRDRSDRGGRNYDRGSGDRRDRGDDRYERESERSDDRRSYRGRQSNRMAGRMDRSRR